MAKKRRLKVVPPKVSTYPWVVVKVNDASLGVRFSPVDAAQTRKGADALAVKKVSENGGVYAVLQYRNVFAPQVVGRAPVGSRGIKAPKPAAATETPGAWNPNYDPLDYEEDDNREED